MNQLNQPNVFLHHTQLPSGKLTWQWKNPHFLIGNYICSPGPFFFIGYLSLPEGKLLKFLLASQSRP